MKNRSCQRCAHRDNCGAAAKHKICNSFLWIGEVYADQTERDRTEKERGEYREAFRSYAADDCDF